MIQYLAKNTRQAKRREVPQAEKFRIFGLFHESDGPRSGKTPGTTAGQGVSAARSPGRRRTVPHSGGAVGRLVPVAPRRVERRRAGARRAAAAGALGWRFGKIIRRMTVYIIYKVIAAGQGMR